jgi:hypothetical protein
LTIEDPVVKARGHLMPGAIPKEFEIEKIGRKIAIFSDLQL